MYSVRVLKQPQLLSQLVLVQPKSTLSLEYIQQSSVPTMHFQKSLPRLPIPQLDLTCTRYLNAQKPLLTAEQFQKTESLVREFLQKPGPQLQQQLQFKDKRNKHTSYISEPWFDMYLRDRKPLPINYNPILIYTREQDERYNDPLVKATNLIISSMRFCKSLRAGILEPEVFHLDPKKSDTKLFRRVTGLLPSAVSWYGAYMFNAYPLDMSQYKSLFNTTRIPTKNKDKIVTDPSAKHIVVLRNGHFYSFDVLDQNGGVVSAKQIAANLKEILQDRRPMNEKSVGIFTAANRNDWAELRSHLEGVGNNGAILRKIDSAAFVLILDDETVGEDYNNLIRTYLYGNAKNRWYDKSFCLIITKDGHSGINFEHSWGDGVAVLRYFQDVKKDISERPALRPEELDNLAGNSNIERLDFAVDERIEGATRTENAKFQDWVSGLDVQCMMYEGFGKDTCKKLKISPDAVMQLSFQMAFYSLEGRSVATYESCSTAAFKQGRTETIRPCTLQTKEFCKAMVKRTIKDDMRDFKGMLVECSKAHSQLVKEAAMGQGFDRHLFALKNLTEGEKIGLFEDPAYAGINYNILSTSTLSSPVVLAGGFGPVVEDGFGIGYRIDKTLGVVVTSYKKHRSAADYVGKLETAVSDIIRLLSVK